jgi:hypothetical protein
MAVIVALGVAAWRGELPVGRSGMTIHLPAWGRVLVGAAALGAAAYEIVVLISLVRRNRPSPPAGSTAP